VDVASKVKKVVHWMPEILFAAEIAFRSLDRCVSEQELNLLKLTTAGVAKLRTRPAEVMRCNMLQPGSLAASLDHIPHDILRDAAAPHLSHSGDCSEDFAFSDPGCLCPLVEGRFDPVRNGNGADVATLANEINHCPVLLAHLDIIQL
jgi:hypothetical protein